MEKLVDEVMHLTSGHVAPSLHQMIHMLINILASPVDSETCLCITLCTFIAT